MPKTARDALNHYLLTVAVVTVDGLHHAFQHRGENIFRASQGAGSARNVHRAFEVGEEAIRFERKAAG